MYRGFATRLVTTIFSFTLFAVSGIVIGVPNAEAQTATFVLQWTPPATTTGITSYRVYVRPAGGSYTSAFYSVNGATASTLTISDKAPGSYFFKAVSYNGTAESAATAEVAATAIPVALEGLTIAQTTGVVFSVSAFNSGQTTAIASSNSVANSSGVITLPSGSTGLPAIFDLKISAPTYLADRILDRGLNSTSTLAPLLAGDLNGSGRVELNDYALLKPNWNTANALADINKDGFVNSGDYLLMKRNWNAVSDS